MLWCLDVLLKESVDNKSIWFLLLEEGQPIKGKDKAQRVYTCWNPKRHIPPVSLFLAVHCFVRFLALRLCQ